MTKTESQRLLKEAVHKLLNDSDRAVDRAVVALFKRQTAAEQASESTQVHNNVGFSGADAAFLSSLAKSAIQYGSLTFKQRHHARRIVRKYWVQLADIAAKNGRPIVVEEAPLQRVSKPSTMVMEKPHSLAVTIQNIDADREDEARENYKLAMAKHY